MSEKRIALAEAGPDWTPLDMLELAASKHSRATAAADLTGGGVYQVDVPEGKAGVRLFLKASSAATVYMVAVPKTEAAAGGFDAAAYAAAHGFLEMLAINEVQRHVFGIPDDHTMIVSVAAGGLSKCVPQWLGADAGDA